MSTLKNTIVNDTGFLTLPVGTTAQRPGSAANGMMRYNSNTGAVEAYVGGSWRSVGVADDYETINLVGNNGNLTINGNGTTTASAFKTQGGGGWDTQVYMTTGYTAPVTMEFNKEAGAGDNSQSYAMISWNADPTSDASYSSLDYASYPFNTNGYHIYHNGSNLLTSGAWSTAQKFYLVYATNGFMYHYNGSTLLYSVNYGTGATVYLDTSFYSPNGTYGGFSNIRITKRAWNGTAYA